MSGSRTAVLLGGEPGLEELWTLRSLAAAGFEPRVVRTAPPPERPAADPDRAVLEASA